MNNLRQGFWNTAFFCTIGVLVLTSSHGHAGSIIVTNLADSGLGSLRASVANANDGDVISFAVTGTITNQSVELVVNKSISIQGPGPGAITISGRNTNRAFSISSGATLSLSGLTILDGRARDGAKGTDPGTPGSPGEHGGAIYNSGTLVMSNCVITRCRSGAGGAGYSDLPFPSLGGSSAGGTGGNGGAIYNAGSLTLIQCSLMTNACSSGGAGGKPVTHLFGSAGGAGGNGGGIFDMGDLIIMGCTFGYNSAGNGGAGGVGGIGDLDGDAGGGGLGGLGGDGGAIFSLGGPTLVSCTLSRNAAGAGGSGGAGGAGWSGSFSPSNGGGGSDGGAGGSGGALMCSGSFQAVACTISENATGKGGNGGAGGSGGSGIGAPGGNGGNGGNGGPGGGGGGGNDSSGSASLQNVLVAQNSTGLGGSAGSGGAGGNGFPRGSSGSAGSSGNPGSGPDLLGSYVSNGHNLNGRDEGNTGFNNGVMNDLVGSGSSLNPLLGPLANNGSHRLTCALLAGSPAIDAGDDALLGTPHNLITDQRGMSRLIGSHVDIGAFELRPAVEPIRLAAQKTNGVFLITLTNLPGASLTVLASTNSSATASNWSVLGSASEPNAGQFQFSDSANLPVRVYRVRSP